MKVSFGGKPLDNFRLTGKISGKAHRVILLAIQKNEDETGFAPPIDAAIDALILKAAASDKELKQYIAEADKQEKESRQKDRGKAEETKHQARAQHTPVVGLKQATPVLAAADFPQKQAATA